MHSVHTHSGAAGDIVAPTITTGESGIRSTTRFALVIAAVLALLLATGSTVFGQDFDAGLDPVNMSYVPAEGENSTLLAQESSGQYIVDFALQFQGYPYVYAGNGPGGFDCSGFTQYVILNTIGIDIGHGVEGQTGYGAYVEWGAWLPGDLVYFANTYRAGISHTGVYIGDGQFIHAENEGTGVVISSIYSDYYSGHYATATRLW